MKLAIKLAKKGYNPSPNPKVGCVIVKNGKVVGEGFHEKSGKPHAEIIALRKAKTKAKDATLFVTLSPCNHVGKTPPCSKAILNSGVKKVVVGCEDKSKAKGGIEFLRKNGVEVEVGVCEKECEELNQIWLKNVKRKLPYLALKLAMDKQGNTIPKSGKWITNASSRREVMQMRRSFDAILVGVNTIIVDNPRLSVRNLKIMKQPLLIILDGSNRIPKNAMVLNDGKKTLLVSKIPPNPPLQKGGVKNLTIKNLNLKTLLKSLWKMGITSIFVEGGEETAKRLLKQNLIDRVWIFQKNAKRIPKVCGKKLPLKKVRKFGSDTLFEARLKKY